mgnify:CR=1 FL=1
MTRQMMDETIKKDQERDSQPSAKSGKSVIRQYAEAVIIAIILALVIRSFVIQAFKIPSGSMLQTLQIGDHILVNKFLYWFTDLQHGDIIVFKFPQDEGRDFIKRVVALPGEKVEVREKQVYINDKSLTEPYTVHLDPAIIENPGSARDNFGPVVVAPGQLFMMGDTRDYSMDSRFWGFLDMKKIKGKAFIIYWSWDHERFRPRWERIGMLVR